MAGASLKIEVIYNDAEVQRMLRRLVAAGANMSTVFSDIGEYLLISHNERFGRQEGPDGAPWVPLKEETRKRKKQNKDKILVEFGDLRDLLRYDAGDDGLEFGTDRIYGATQQFGREEAGIPARPFLGISAEDQVEILAILKRHLEMVVSGRS